MHVKVPPSPTRNKSILIHPHNGFFFSSLSFTYIFFHASLAISHSLFNTIDGHTQASAVCIPPLIVVSAVKSRYKFSSEKRHTAVCIVFRYIPFLSRSLSSVGAGCTKYDLFVRPPYVFQYTSAHSPVPVSLSANTNKVFLYKQSCFFLLARSLLFCLIFLFLWSFIFLSLLLIHVCTQTLSPSQPYCPPEVGEMVECKEESRVMKLE